MKYLFVVLMPLFLTLETIKTDNCLGNAVPSTKDVVILPLGNVDGKIIKNIIDSVKHYFPNITVLEKENMPASAWYNPRKRYRADTLIHWMARRALKNQIYLGVTGMDISTTKGDNPDHGIMGLGYCPGNACIISSYRIRNKSNVYKVAIHELGHTLGLPHCPNVYCYMQDAKGKDITGREKYLCGKCINAF